MKPLSAAELAQRRDEIYATSFAPDLSGARSVGAEVELLALDVATRKPLALVDGALPLIRLLRRYGAEAGWTEFAGYDGTVRFDAPGSGIISFEPGGQIELSSMPSSSVSELARQLRAFVVPLRERLLSEGAELVSIGIDPYNDANDIPMQLPVDRYERMTRHFESIGPFGIRMMRQTAAIQVSIDRGETPARRWRLLNDLAPYLIAIFANSSQYRGEDTGHQSFRAQCWRQLDPSRTGMAEPSDDPAAAYVRFATGASDIVGTDWASHLTTLFPEVRPRGHYEVRSCDAVDPRWYAAPIVFISALAYDERSANEAALLASDSRALLRTAGERGMHDPAIARTSRDLFQLALDGATRLGPSFIDAETLAIAAEFYSTFTARDRSPADDANFSRMRTVRSRSSRV
ncbi:MAG TPA: glutamate-cysteine ligase family protein [Gemmatimonadaceae bacterium]